jgi:flavin reductase (DIM6/NTAB) family NADH-FMN oxidoreductase RutF
MRRADSQQMLDRTQDESAARQDFLNAMARVATSVAVVATDGPAGCFGVTVSAFASVSADPPMVLVCINRRSPVVGAIGINGVMTLNILGAGQSAIADVFAGRSLQHKPFDFSCAEWGDGGLEGARHLNDAAVSLHVAITTVQEVETHAVILGRVIATCLSGTEPLIYAQSRYGRPAFLAAGEAPAPTFVQST